MARKTVTRRKDITIAACLAVATIAAAAALHFVLVRPARAAATRQLEDLRKAKTDLSGKREKELEFQKLGAAAAALRVALAKFDRRIPEKDSLPALFAEVLKLAEQDKTRIALMKPGEPVAVGRTVQEFPYELELHGSYHDVARFLADIESHEKFMTVTRASVLGAADEAVRAQVVLCLYGSLPARPAEEPPGKQNKARASNAKATDKAAGKPK